MNFPFEPEQLTVEWLTDTLRQANVLQQARIQSFEVKKLSGIQGAIAQNAIITLTYDGAESGAPRSIFAKFAQPDPERRARFRNGYEQEVRFYKDFAHRVDFPTPEAYFGDYDEATGFFLLLLEDCSSGSIGDRATGCSVNEARIAVTEIAKFHATWWAHPDLTQYSWPIMQDSFLNPIQERYQHFADTLEGIPEIPRDPELLQTIKEHSSQFVAFVRHLQQAPFTLIHNDYQLDNFIFVTSDDTTSLMVVDWQLTALGRGTLDVASLLGGNISIAERRVHEKDMLRLYYDTLCENGLEDYTFGQCWDDYRMSMLDGLFRMVHSLGNRTLREEQYIAHRDVIAPRFFAAVLDLNSQETLGRLT